MKEITKLLLCSLLLFSIISCVASQETDKNKDNNHKKNTTDNDMQENFYEEITNSSLELFKNLSSQNKSQNFSFSPVSLHLAMGMVYTGSRNNTAEEISKTMGYNINTDIFNKDFSVYYNYLNSFSKDTSLDFNIANRIFLENTFKVKKKYKETITKYFAGAFQSADFLKNAEKERNNINSWVEEITKNKIQNLIPENGVNSSTAMVLVNALYIKALWKYEFNKKDTRKKDFFGAPEIKYTTEFMTKKQKNGYKYTEYNDCQILELPYTSDNLSLIIILPKNSNYKNIGKYIPDYKVYTEIIKNLQLENIYLEIPKFKVESSFELTKNLKELGINDAFGNANFSGISDSKNLAVSNIFQKVFFEIDEQGTEAAAATGIVMTKTAIILEEEYIDFIANKPFIFILKENNNNTPLFTGMYIKP